MFTIDGYQAIKNELKDILKNKFIFYKVKESPWARVYHVIEAQKKYLLKVGIAELDHTGVKNEYDALKLLYQNKVYNIPIVKYHGRMNSHYLLLTEFVNSNGVLDAHILGQTFAKIHNIRKKYKHDCYYTFAMKKMQYLYFELENIRYIFFKRDSNAPEKIAEHIKLILDNLSRTISNNYKWFQGNGKLSFLNNDNSDNVLTQNNVIIITDWHLAGFGDPAWDLSRLLSYYKFKTIDTNKFLKAYLAFYKDNGFLGKRIAIYNIINEIFYLLYNYSDRIDLVRYKSNPLINNPAESSVLAKALRKRILGIITRIKEKIENNFKGL